MRAGQEAAESQTIGEIHHLSFGAIAACIGECCDFRNLAQPLRHRAKIGREKNTASLPSWLGRATGEKRLTSDVTLALLRDSPMLPGPLSPRERTRRQTEVKRMPLRNALTAEVDPQEKSAKQLPTSDIKCLSQYSTG
jgi:hypothetical protein